LERLYRLRWTGSDGLAALIISPARELALQIFEVVRQVGQAHYGLSAGVVCGGKDFAEEQAGITGLALLVATPGRLLQHLEQTPGFDASELRVLVLDEADRLLDMGFTDTLNAILAYLPPPPQRQTMLYSATQTKSVKDLARLSLTSPQYVAVHDTAESATPARLAQTYVVAKLPDKLNVLYSFIRTHLTAKVIVFLSACKEARFVFEAFRRLRPGVPLQLLHGKMKQQRRMLVYYDFLKKPACVLFATDIAARGLDFPAVDWVVQLDCPEDVPTYIHRVGRTARFRAKGSAMLLLTPSEAPAMVPKLAAAKIPVKQVHINPSAALSITGKIAAEVAADVQLKALAQHAFRSYLRSLYLQPDKTVFTTAGLPLEAFSESYGLAVMPDVSVTRALAAMDPAAARAEAHAKKNENKALARLKETIAARKAARKAAAAGGAGAAAADSDDDEDDDDDDDDDDSDDSGSDSGDGSSGSGSGSDSDSEGGELLQLKKHSEALAAAEGGDLHIPTAMAAAMSERDRARLFAVVRDTKALASGGGYRDADGMTPMDRVAAAQRAKPALSGAALAAAADAAVAKLKARLEASAPADRERERVRVRAKHREERLRAKGKLDDDDDERERDADGVEHIVCNGKRWVPPVEEEEESEGEEGSSDEEGSEEEVAAPPKARLRSMVVTAPPPTASASASSGSKRPVAPAPAHAGAPGRGPPPAKRAAAAPAEDRAHSRLPGGAGGGGGKKLK